MLTLKGVTKNFGTLRAVDGVSLTVRGGEVVGLLGPNGAGKSTTISMVTGLLRPDAGEIDVEGRGAPSRREIRARLGVAPQTLALYDELTARENLIFFGSIFGLKGGSARRRADELLAEVGLGERGDDRVRTFSGGMRRRLNLAAALVHDPPIVLLDEPTAGVDPQSRNRILEQVRALRDRGCAVVYTTHYMEEAQRLCDRVAIIDQGRLLAEGGVESLIAAHGGAAWITAVTPAGDERRQTSDPLRDLQRVVSRPDVVSIRIDRPDLESVFLNLTGRTLRD